jgi:ABC-type glutathione transport system ATPase component
MNLLTVQNVRKHFIAAGHDTTLVAVDDVSFDLRAGDSLAIVGESGSGKTTCARIIAGLERPTTGVVTIGDAKVEYGRGGRHARLQRARRAQMVFQDPYASLDPRQTVAATLEEVLIVHARGNRQHRKALVEELLDKVGLDARIGSSLPRRLSGGQRQRVAIARALAAEPRLLILDEAVAALDVSVQAQVLNLLSELRTNDGISYLFVSHDLAVVRQISTHCVVMHHGRIVERGTTDDVLDHPTHPYTQRLLDAVPRPGWTPRTRTSIATSPVVKEPT